MLPTNSITKPSATKMQNHGPEEHPSVQSPPEMVKSNKVQDCRNDWGDTNGQVDYFVSAGFNNDSIYNTALVDGSGRTGGNWSISPIRPSSRHGNAGNPAGQTYPSQELNPRYGSLQLSPPQSDGSMKPPPLPPPLPLTAGNLASKFHVDEVASMATLAGMSRGTFGKFRVEEVTSMETGLTQDINNLSTQTDGGVPTNDNSNVNELDSFELESVDEDLADADSFAIGQLKSEGLDDDSGDDDYETKPKRVSNSPRVKKSGSRAAKSRKKTKIQGKTKKNSNGIARPTRLDILRGRGGKTNRHPGNMEFRDEARKMRVNYRDDDTSRREKFLLSQELLGRVKEYGGRFLEKGTDNLWHEMSEKDARKKCSQVLREEKWN